MSLLPESLFALRLEPGKTYSQEVEQSFKISMATLVVEEGKEANLSKRLSVSITIDGDQHILCNLIPGAIEQQMMDLTVPEGEEVTFQLVGAGACVDLIGNCMIFLEDEDMEDEEIDSDMEVSDMEGEVEEDTEVDESENEEMAEAELEDIKAEILKRKQEHEEETVSKKLKDNAGKAAKLEKKAEVAKKSEASPAAKKDEKKAEKKAEATKKNEASPAPKKEEKKVEKKAAASPASKTDDNKVEKKVDASPASKKEEKKAEKKSDASPPKKDEKKELFKKTLPNGLVLEDVSEGSGPKAKKGKKIAVRYIGKLANGKTFDSNTKGKPFTFKLGSGDVIKGWDLGFEGMKVGGTRKLTIPPALAYGPRGAPPDIPPNSTLSFEVKLLEVKN